MLNLLKNGEVIRQVYPGTKLDLDGVSVSPAEAGWSYEDYELVEAPPPEPEPEPEPPTPEEIRAAMPPLQKWRFETIIDLSGLREQIETAIQVMPEPDRTVAFNKRNHVPEFFRNDPLFSALGPQLEMTPEQIDAMWTAALEL